MTTLTLKQNFSLKPVQELVVKVFKGLRQLLVSMMLGYAAARQAEANRNIAPYLKHEYPGKTEAEIVAELNAKMVKELFVHRDV